MRTFAVNNVWKIKQQDMLYSVRSTYGLRTESVRTPYGAQKGNFCPPFGGLHFKLLCVLALVKGNHGRRHNLIVSYMA